MPFDIFKITKSDFAGYLQENPHVSSPLFMQEVFYCDFISRKDIHKAIQYFANLVPENAEAVINYKQTIETKVPDFLYLKPGEKLKDKVYIEMTGQAIITKDSLLRKILVH